MKLELPKIVRNSTIYSFMSFLQKGIGFLLLPVYTAFLTPDDYGVMNLLSSVMGFFSILILLSLHGAATRFHFRSDNSSYKARVWGTILLLVIANSLFWTGAAVCFHTFLVDPLLSGVSFWELTIFSVINVSFSPLYLFYQAWLQTNEDGKHYAINMFINFGLTTIFNILAIAVLKLGVKGMLLSSLTVSIIFFIYSLYRFIPKLDFHFDKQIAKEAFSYSLPLVPHSLTGYASVMLDRVLMNVLSNKSVLGLYSVANQFGSIVNFVTSGINQAYSPWFMKECSTGKPSQEKINSFAECSVVLTSLLALFLVFFSPEVVRLMTSSSSYHLAWQPVIFISFGFVLNGLYYFFSMPLFLNSTPFVMFVSISQLIVNFGLNVLLIPQWGYFGAGCSFVASELVSTIMALILSIKRCSFVKYQWRKLYLIVLFFFLLASTVFVFEGVDSIFIRSFSKVLVVLLVCLCCFFRYKSTVKLIFKY